MSGEESTIVGNVYDKYGSRNPIARRLMDAFLASVAQLYAQAKPRSVLEVGCGEGKLADHLVRHAGEPERFIGTDLNLDHLASGLHPLLEFKEASVYELPYADGEFDLVVCCEVLEHLERPREALKELDRITSRCALVSTPREPLWRMLNVARGKYLRDWGNTPGHVQHFSRDDLRRLLAERFQIVAESHPLPWTMFLAEKNTHVK